MNFPSTCSIDFYKYYIILSHFYLFISFFRTRELFIALGFTSRKKSRQISITRVRIFMKNEIWTRTCEILNILPIFEMLKCSLIQWTKQIFALRIFFASLYTIVFDANWEEINFIESREKNWKNFLLFLTVKMTFQYFDWSDICWFWNYFIFK